MADIKLENSYINIGERFGVSFQRTLRIPDDGKTYPLPPGLHRFPVHRVSEFNDSVPSNWRKENGFFICMYQREAMWISFHGAYWKPNVVKIAAGMINVVTGEEWEQGLSAEPQDYMVVPAQPWIDGFNTGEGHIRQFVAMPLGYGYSVEEQLTGEAKFGGIQIALFEPKPGKFPDKPPEMVREFIGDGDFTLFEDTLGGAEVEDMGLAQGGKIEQKIYPDEYGIDTWDEGSVGSVFIHIVNSRQYEQITGSPAPPTPITASTYTQYGLPWFKLFDEQYGDVDPSKKLKGVKSLKDIDDEKGIIDWEDHQEINIDESQTVKLKPNKKGDA